MIRVYIAGPYSAPTPTEIERNVWRAIDAWHRLADAGLIPFLPHLFHYIEARRPRPYEQWMAHDLVWLECCDAVVRLDGASPGADREVAIAKGLGLAVYTVEEAIRDLGRTAA